MKVTVKLLFDASVIVFLKPVSARWPAGALDSGYLFKRHGADKDEPSG